VTFSAAPTADGAASSLELRVNDVRWHERRSFVGAAPTDHVFTTETDADARTTVVCGDGRTGARLPTGVQNVTAVYRSGIGKAGNVDAKQISLLGTRPLGLTEVVNPLPATGGANADRGEQLRRNIPIALQALDRLISVRDYQDFARAFAGIGKASAVQLPDGEQKVVHVTIAGVDDIPILESDDLFLNLGEAFALLGDARQPVMLAVRELVMLVIDAGIKVHPDHRWEVVEPKIRRALLNAFGFEAHELGQSVSGSEVLAVIQRVPGVEYADLNAFGGIPERVRVIVDEKPSRRLITAPQVAARVREIAATSAGPPSHDCPWPPIFCPVRASLAHIDADGLIAPAQLVMLSPDVPDSLILSLVP
jgi:predicted phage baseplate assembly protein